MNRLKAMRVRVGLTQANAAAKIGVTPSAVAQWERGYPSPRFQRLTRIAEVYQCSVEDLLGDGTQFFDDDSADNGGANQETEESQ